MSIARSVAEKVNLYQFDVMKHAIGFRREKVKRGKYIAWRNYFCCYGGSKDWDHLVSLGFAIVDRDRAGADYYFVTAEGLELLASVLEIKIVEDDG